MTPEMKAALDRVTEELANMSPEEFAAELEKHKDSDLLPFIEAHVAANAPQPPEEAPSAEVAPEDRWPDEKDPMPPEFKMLSEYLPDELWIKKTMLVGAKIAPSVLLKAQKTPKDGYELWCPASRLRSTDRAWRAMAKQATQFEASAERNHELLIASQERERSLREALEKITKLPYTHADAMDAIASAALTCPYCKADPCRCVPGA